MNKNDFKPVESGNGCGAPPTEWMTLLESNYGTMATKTGEIPLVNVYKTMERSTIFNGKTHYFYGKLPHNYGKIHQFQWDNSLFLWPFSVAMLVYQRVNPLGGQISQED